ncbi:hypothetical protein BDV19DRAFT_382935 [Aspergillus venezuelensis]
MDTALHSPRAPGVPYYTRLNNPGAAVNPGQSTPTLFCPLQIRDVTFKNRIIVAPMCMFSSESDPRSPAVGALTDFHIGNLGHLATKGAGLVMIEATAVQPNGRISPNDAGLWCEGQVAALRRVVDIVHSQGAKIGFQLAHAERKASVVTPWLGPRGIALKADESVGGWPEDVVAPSGEEEFKWAPGETSYWAPREMSVEGIREVVEAFADSARLAVGARVDVIEVHGAHGYLLHEFLSPVMTAVRGAVPDGVPLLLRISGTEWLEGAACAAEVGSWDLNESIRLALLLQDWGVDLVDVDLAGEIQRAIWAAGQNTKVGAVGLICEPEVARDIVQGADKGNPGKEEPKGDVVLIARQFLRDPNWSSRQQRS